MSKKIATEQEAFAIGKKGTPQSTKACIKLRADQLGCKVSGNYDNNQCVKLEDLSKSAVKLTIWAGMYSVGDIEIPDNGDNGNISPYVYFEAWIDENHRATEVDYQNESSYSYHEVGFANAPGPKVNLGGYLKINLEMSAELNYCGCYIRDGDIDTAPEIGYVSCKIVEDERDRECSFNDYLIDLSKVTNEDGYICFDFELG